MYLLIYLYTCFEMDQRMVVGSVGQFLFEISLDSFFFFGINKSSTGFIYYWDSRILFKVFLKVRINEFGKRDSTIFTKFDSGNILQ